MEFKITETLSHDLERVYRTYRDRLAELVPYLPNVDAIEVLEREEREQGPRLVNYWKVGGSVPRAVRPFFKDDDLTYKDHADWDDAAHKVNWRFEFSVLADAVSASGTNHFRPGPRPGTTELELGGRLEVDLSRIRGIPRLLHRLAPTVERFVIDRVKPNLASVARAVDRYLSENKDQI